MTAQVLDPVDRAVLRALATAAIPPGRLLPGASESTLDRAEGLLAALPPAVAATVRGMLRALEWGALPIAGGRFSTLPLGRRLKALERLEALEGTRLALRGLLALVKLAYTDDRQVYAALGCRFAVEPPRHAERARWKEQLVDAATLSDSDELECDVVIVGTGAGGAPLADELASRGLAVLLVEEGPYYGRQDFNGRPLEMLNKTYRRAGLTVALGNTAIPIPVGRAVGGTTLINSGTCFRTPPAVLRSWGITGLDADALAPYYQRVERFLEVGPSSPTALGKPAELIARGCDALGYSHHPLARNAPGCDGQGLCCFGCPTEAKRSTNVSYVPAALGRGAQLVHGLKVDRVRLAHGRAIGVEGTARHRRLKVRAKATVLSCGALHTPVLLLSQGLAGASNQAGRNLSIHPAAGALGVFDQRLDASSTVPQGYSIDEFKDEGLLFEGANAPLELAAVSVSGYGPRFTHLLEQLPNGFMFGFMVKDTSRGRVRAGTRGEPLITYWLNRHDVGKVRRGLALLSRVFFAAGAREVHLPITGSQPLRSVDETYAFEQAPLAARHVDLTAYHPLGTCRMGEDPGRSVVDPLHRVHHVPSLFVVDGSVMPSSLGVNPQLTIMAMALRAAEGVARQVEASYARAA